MSLMKTQSSLRCAFRTLWMKHVEDEFMYLIVKPTIWFLILVVITQLTGWDIYVLSYGAVVVLNVLMLIAACQIGNVYLDIYSHYCTMWRTQTNAAQANAARIFLQQGLLLRSGIFVILLLGIRWILWLIANGDGKAMEPGSKLFPVEFVGQWVIISYLLLVHNMAANRLFFISTGTFGLFLRTFLIDPKRPNRNVVIFSFALGYCCWIWFGWLPNIPTLAVTSVREIQHVKNSVLVVDLI